MKDVTLEVLPRGNSRIYRVEVTVNETPSDLSLWKLFFTMKKSYDESDDLAVVKKDGEAFANVDDSDPTVIYSTVELLPADTDDLEIRKYYYDFKVVTEDDREYTVQKGTIAIDYSVTRRAVSA